MPGFSGSQSGSKYKGWDSMRMSNPMDLWNNVNSGSTYRQKNGNWVEYDIFGQEVGGQPPASQNGESTGTNGGSTPPVVEAQTKSYGGVSGGYGSGDAPTQTSVTPDGGPAGGGTVPPTPVERKPITFGGSVTGKGPKAMFARRLQGMTIPAEALANVPETDLAKIYAAAEKGFGAFRDFMQQNRNAPWFNDVSSATKSAFASAKDGIMKGGVRNPNGGGWGGPGNTGIGWLDQTYRDNMAKRRIGPIDRGGWPTGGPVGNPDLGTVTNFPIEMTPWTVGGPMMFIDQNQDGIDDRAGTWPRDYIGVPGMGGPTNYQPGRPQMDPRMFEILMGQLPEAY